MKQWTIKPINDDQSLVGSIELPGDKSLSHRAAIFALLSKGTSRIRNFLASEDCLNTLKITRQLGSKITKGADGLIQVKGCGINGLKAPKKVLYCGNSGTTMRLLTGLLAGQPFESSLDGDTSLRSRPMDRVVTPLSGMGAKIKGSGARVQAPIQVIGQPLKNIKYKMTIPSAQVKSCLLFAALYTSGKTVITEPIATRDHTERYYRYLGQQIIRRKQQIHFTPGRPFKAFSWKIPGDTSSAAFMMVAAALISGSEVNLKHVLWNPGRIGIVHVLKRMGVQIKIQKITQSGPEKVANLKIFASKLKAANVSEKEAPSLIDEFPILMIAATQAKGISKFYGVEELRVKETDRVHSMVTQLQQMGADIKDCGRYVQVKGPTPLKGAVIDSFGDHRTAMSFAIAGLIATQGRTIIRRVECVATSFPNFKALLKSLGVSRNMV